MMISIFLNDEQAGHTFSISKCIMVDFNVKQMNHGLRKVAGLLEDSP